MAKNNSGAAPAQEESENAMPLFFKNPVPVDAERHAKAGIVLSNDTSFARGTNSLLLNAVEFVEAAKYFPIVFTQDGDIMPAVLTGLESRNYFVGDDGQWRRDTYVPAYVRRYPFVFMDVPEQNQFVLCVDEAAPQFRAKADAKAIPFYKDGQPTELAVNALDFCTSFQKHYQITREFCKDLQAMGLLKSMRSDAKLQNGREIRLAGFQVIDEDKLNELSDAQILDLHKKGWLPLVYFALLSSSNWRNLINLAAEFEK